MGFGDLLLANKNLTQFLLHPHLKRYYLKFNTSVRDHLDVIRYWVLTRFGNFFIYPLVSSCLKNPINTSICFQVREPKLLRQLSAQQFSSRSTFLLILGFSEENKEPKYIVWLVHLISKLQIDPINSQWPCVSQ